MISLGLCLVGQALHRVVVDLFVGVQAVAHDLEPLAAHVQRHAVGQVAAFGQAHAHDGVAGLQQAEEHGLVGLRAGVGLHVGVLGAEQLLDAVDGQLLDDVDVLAAAVVALAGIALGVLVGELACPARPSRPARRSSREAISSMCSSWRRFSRWIAAAISGSTLARVEVVRSNMEGSPSRQSARIECDGSRGGPGERLDRHERRRCRPCFPVVTHLGLPSGAASPVARRCQCSGATRGTASRAGDQCEQGDLVVGVGTAGRSGSRCLDRGRGGSARPPASAAPARPRAAVIGDPGAAGDLAQDALLGQDLVGVAAVLAAVGGADVGAQPGLEAAGAARCTPSAPGRRRAGW